MKRKAFTSRPRVDTWGLIFLIVCLLALFPEKVSWGERPQRQDTDSFRADSMATHKNPSPLTWPLTAFISLYQKTISPQQGDICTFQPTCSNYAQQALNRYGLLHGGLMASDRLQRCNYCATGWYPLLESGRSWDPVEDHNLWGIHQTALQSLQRIAPPFPYAQGSSHLAFADDLGAQGDYQRAYEQYAILFQEQPDHPQSLEARLRAGVCLQKLGRWKESEEVFEGLISPSGSDLVRWEATFQMALSQHLNNRTSQALATSAPLLKTPLEDRTSLFHAWAHLYQGNWSLAISSLESASFDTAPRLSQTAQMMKNHATQGPHLPKRSPALAALLSTVLPGSGKWYSGKALDGIYSLLLTGSSAAVAASYGHDMQWTKSGFFGAMGLFFYLGNIYGAAAEAQRFNQIQNQVFLDGLEKTAHPEEWLWRFEENDTTDADSLAMRPSFDLAETLFTRGQYDQAIIEYRRQLFYFPEDSHRHEAQYKIGLAYLNKRDWLKAREQLRKVKGDTISDVFAYRSQLRLAQSYLSQEAPERSQPALGELLAKSQSAEEESEAQYWLGICVLHQGRWTEATGLFHDVSQSYPNSAYSQRARQLEWASQEGYRLPRRSPPLAAALSFILPGAGQIYSGRIWNGLFSFALNTTAGYLTIDAFRDDRRLDGILLAALVWSRFYFGGSHNASRYSREFNRQRKEEHLEKYRELIRPEYLD